MKILLASWNHTNQIWGLWTAAALTRRLGWRASRAWQGVKPDCLVVLIFLKMERIPVLKDTQVFQNLAPSPTYLHTSDSRGKNNPPAIHLLQGLLASLYIFFTVELFLILVLAKRNTEQQWLRDVWKLCQAKQCLKVCLRSSNLVREYFSFTRNTFKHLWSQTRENEGRKGSSPKDALRQPLGPWTRGPRAREESRDPGVQPAPEPPGGSEAQRRDAS